MSDESPSGELLEKVFDKLDARMAELVTVNEKAIRKALATEYEAASARYFQERSETVMKRILELESENTRLRESLRLHEAGAEELKKRIAELETTLRSAVGAVGFESGELVRLINENKRLEYQHDGAENSKATRE